MPYIMRANIAVGPLDTGCDARAGWGYSVGILDLDTQLSLAGLLGWDHQWGRNEYLARIIYTWPLYSGYKAWLG